jgi:CHAT domain-containing protein
MPYVEQRSRTEAEVAELVTELDTAEPKWRSNPARFAEHYGLLADMHHTRYSNHGDRSELERALEVFHRVEGIAEVSGLVAGRLQMLGITLRIAMARRDGGPYAMGATVSASCATLRQELRQFGAPSLLCDLGRNATRWAADAMGLEQPNAVADALDLAARAADQLFRTVEVDRRLQVIAEYRTVPCAAASALTRVGRYEEAVVTLENGRQRMTRYWRGQTALDRVLRVQRPNLFDGYIQDQAAFAAAAREPVRAHGAAAVDLARERAKEAESRLMVTLDEVRKIPEFENYMLRSSIAEIRQAAADNPILYISTSDLDTVLLLVLTDGSILAAQMESITAALLDKVLAQWISILEPSRLADGRERQMALALVGKVLEQNIAQTMGDILVYPFNHPSDAQAWRWGPVTLVVSGQLSYVPVHAWTPAAFDKEDGTIRGLMPLSYAPSARQLRTARRSPCPTGKSRSLLSIADPEPRASGVMPLYCARIESAKIAETAATSRLLHGRRATRDAFLTHAPQHEVLHLACHASVGAKGPGGRLELAGGGLPLEDVLRTLSLDHVALVVLSACRTGQPDRLIPEESLEFGSLFLAAGARGVIASMWPVDELAAALYVWHLFDLWDWGNGLPVSAAADASRQWLRDLTVADLLAIGEGEPMWLPSVRRYTHLLEGEPTLKRFWEPYYWAAFTYAGG